MQTTTTPMIFPLSISLNLFPSSSQEKMLPNNNAIIFLFSYLPLETQIVNNQLWGDLARWQNLPKVQTEATRLVTRGGCYVCPS